MSAEIIKTDSGLGYIVAKEGEGAKPVAGQDVMVHYEGRLTDGTIFDSSYKRGQPATFPVDGVIPGFAEGLMLMSPGAEYELHIPSDLGYGAYGAGAVIPPNADLIFKVELISIV